MKFKFIVVLLCGLLFTGTVSGLVKGNEDHPVFVTKDYLTDYVNDCLNNQIADFMAAFVKDYASSMGSKGRDIVVIQFDLSVAEAGDYDFVIELVDVNNKSGYTAQGI